MFQSEPGSIQVLRPKSSVAAINLRKRRAWFEGDPAPTPAPTPAPPPANNGDDKGKTFTQDDLNRIVGERAARAKESGIADFLKELGFEKPDDLKALVKSAKERDDAEKSELEKAQKERDGWKTKAEQAEAAATKAAQERLEERRNSAILNALTSGGSKKAASVLNLLIAEHAADVQAAMGEDGALDSKKIDALVKLAKTEYDGLFGSTSPGSPSNSGGKNPAPDNHSILDKLPKVRL